MRVIVGKPSEQTPQMAGLIRYAVARPYWNIPPDLVRDSVAPKVLAKGLGYLAANNFEALSDWSDRPHVLDPASVDWRAVAAGKLELRMRQRPGPKNMMGEVKFMFPNTLGVYLHDTPLKTLFAASPRTRSAGCVRLEHARELAGWIMGAAAGKLSLPGPPEQPLTLEHPIPVYLVYLTAAPDADGRLTLADDIYHRDPQGPATTPAASGS
jgi:murein L,D-transpeptidase YcbB/YkuD